MILDFQPTIAFLSTGEKTAMYTARLGGIFSAVDFEGHPYKFNGSEYVTNLSTDRDTAIKKLEAIAESYGVPYDTSSDFDLNEIRRQTAEQARIVKEREEQQRKEQEERQAIEVKNGVFVVGKYTGLNVNEVAEIDVDYILWLSTNEPSNTPFGTNVIIASEWVEKNPQPISDFVGTIGEKCFFKAKLTKHICYQGMYGFQHMFRFVDDSGNILVVRTSKREFLDLNIGDIVGFEGTVKEHSFSMYEMPNNNKTTVVAKPKILKERETMA